MSLVERLSLRLTEEQREYFLQLVAANPDISVQELYRQVIRPEEE